MNIDKEREAFEAYREKRNALLESEGCKPGSKWHVDQAHNATWEAAVAYARAAQPAEVCDTCHGQGEVWTGENQSFGYMSMQPPEPIMQPCPECGGESAAQPAEQPSEMTRALLRGKALDTEPHVRHTCSMGVGCEEYGVCYAAAQGEPDRCGLPEQPNAAKVPDECMPVPVEALLRWESELDQIAGAWHISEEIARMFAEAAPQPSAKVPDDSQIMQKARELFGWASGLGGFDEAVRELVTFIAAAPQPAAEQCEVCDGTGDVHSQTGEWLGKCPFCDLPAAPAAEQGVGE